MYYVQLIVSSKYFVTIHLPTPKALLVPSPWDGLGGPPRIDKYKGALLTGTLLQGIPTQNLHQADLGHPKTNSNFSFTGGPRPPKLGNPLGELLAGIVSGN